ncbi:MAG TPA: hypothetical protein VN081_03160 [Dongiaceae bacterium]|nr:hypothetical protein [Dongiaceae bacterium]
MQTQVTFQDLFMATMRAKGIPEIAYDPLWENGTGYFDRLAKTKIAEVSKSHDPSGRGILMVPDEEGTIVIFQRIPNDNRLCFHIPVEVYRGGETYVTAGGEMLVGDVDELSPSAQERQLEARMAILSTAIHYIHNSYKCRKGA